MGHFRKEGAQEGGGHLMEQGGGGWATPGPWPPRPKGAGRPHPSSPSSFSTTLGSQGEGCPSSTYIYKGHVGILIKPKIGEKSNKSHDTSYHLSTSLVPRGSKKSRVREGNLPRSTPSRCRNSARRSTSATSVGSEGPGVIVIHRTCVSTRRCHCGIGVVVEVRR